MPKEISTRTLVKKTKDLFELAEAVDWRSYDPRDLLLAPALSGMTRRSPLAARVLVQVGRHMGAGLRQRLAVEPHEESQTIANFLSAAVILCRHHQTWVSPYSKPLTNRLIRKSVQTPAGIGWGLDYPYITRHVSAPAGTPNLRQTVTAMQALLDVYGETHDQRIFQHLLFGAHFLVDDLGGFLHGGQLWYRCWHGVNQPVLSAQAALASLMARLGRTLNDLRFLDLSDRLAKTVFSFQLPNGSWRSVEDEGERTVDGYHFGIILQGLKEYHRYRGGENQLDSFIAIEKGLDFYMNHLITPQGVPRSQADGPQNPTVAYFAQCIQTLAVCAPGRKRLALARRVWQKMQNALPRVQELETSSAYSFERLEPARHHLFNGHYPKLHGEIAPAVQASARLFDALLARR